jgi:hypothetical protein
MNNRDEYCINTLRWHVNFFQYCLKKSHGGKVRFVSKYSVSPGYWGEAYNSSEIWIYAMAQLDSTDQNAITRYFASVDRVGDAFLDEAYKRFIVHEMGHVFDVRMGQAPRQTVAATTELINTVETGYANGFYAPHADAWQYRLSDQKTHDLEVFADQFIGWVYNKWELNEEGNYTDMAITRSDFMEEYMTRWIREKILLGGN